MSSDERDDKRKVSAPIAPVSSPSAEIDPDAPPTEEEVAASQRLRDALAAKTLGLLDPTGASPPTPDPVRDAVELATSLQAAWSPGALDERLHAEMLDDLPTAEELELAAALRDSLAAGQKKKEDDLVVALRAAWSPAEIEDEEHRAIIAKAIGVEAKKQAPPAKVLTFTPRTVRVITVTTTTVLALAASVIVWMSTANTQGGGTQEAPLAKARSTQPLFDEPFKAGETSARIDKIAIARASDYRDNRFAKWGVR